MLQTCVTSHILAAGGILNHVAKLEGVNSDCRVEHTIILLIHSLYRTDSGILFVCLFVFFKHGN